MVETLKAFLRALLPRPVWERLGRAKRLVIRFLLKTFVLKHDWIVSYFSAHELNELGLNMSPMSDYYSPLPIVTSLKMNKDRWARPSELIGVHYDLGQMEQLLKDLNHNFHAEYNSLPSYDEVRATRYGEGFTPLDAFVLYSMIRHIKPERYIEVGAGISTYYSAEAAKRNAKSGRPVHITAIDPYPQPILSTIENVTLLKNEVQDIPISLFEALRPGDILSIDSTHAVKIDGDVPFLYLEVLPRLHRDVFIHIHDIGFPYNIPYPPKTWILDRDWPFFWNEAMLVQALLCNSQAFAIILSLPLLRHFREDFLRVTLSNYESMTPTPHDTFSSLWLKKGHANTLAESSAC